jgi:hypothetical protein
VHPAGLKALLSATLTPGSATAPTGPATGATYIDSSVSPAVVAVWDGAAWVKQVGTATTSATAPTAPVTGQVYLDTSTSPAVAKLWNGGGWINLTTDTAVQSKLDAQLGGIWTRTGTVLSPATAGDQVHTATGKLTVGGTAAAPNIEIKADGGIVANTDGLVYAAATKRVGMGTTSPLARTHITSTSAGSGAIALRLENDSATAGTETILQFAPNGGNSTTRGAQISGLLASTNGTNLLFYTNPNTASPLERARIDSATGRLLIGTSSARANFSNAVFAPQLQVEGTTNSSSSAALIANGSTSTTNPYSRLFLGRSRGALGTNVVVVDGDVLGGVSYQGNDGSEFVEAASIAAFVDGTPGADDMPGRLVFSTTADGASSPTERMRIKSSGIINFSNVATYADNAAATTGGLAVGDVYRTSTGQLMIRY